MDTSNLKLIYDLSENNLEKLKELSKGAPIVVDDNGKEIHTKYRGLKTIGGSILLLCGGDSHNPGYFAGFNLTALRKLKGVSLKVYEK